MDVQPYLGEIRMFAGNFAPVGWLACDGRELAIGDHEALYSLIGTTYGGDGEQTFALPDLRGRVPVHQGTSATSGTTYPIGAPGGREEVTLTILELPAHRHPMYGSTATGSSDDAAGAVLATAPAVMSFRAISPAVQLNTAAALRPTGGGQPHQNVQPSLCVTYLIATEGIWPSEE